MPTLANDIRQLFAQSVLSRFDRLDEAEIQFTFDHGDVYLSSFAEALEHIDTVGFVESDPNLLAYAQVFERFVTDPVDSVSPAVAGLISAALYWLSGYSANALVIAKAIQAAEAPEVRSAGLLLGLLARDGLSELSNRSVAVFPSLFEYIVSGDDPYLDMALEEVSELRERHLRDRAVDEYISSHLLHYVLKRFGHTSFWSSIRGYTSAHTQGWQRYIRQQIRGGIPMVDLWPSQRKAVTKGLLDGRSSIVICMPTSSGKTKMTELAFVNDLFTDARRRCLYLAPYRALVSEVENDIGHTLTELGFPVASLYGGAEANELEVELTDVARVIIATPEKISAVLKLSGGSLGDFDTIVLDEGHLLDSRARGTAYELQLAALRKELGKLKRAILLSAVLPNSSDIAAWLGGTPEALAEEPWQPSSMRIGVVTWRPGRQARLTYLVQTGQPLTDRFFVPRLLEEDEWRELNPETGRMRTHRFPRREDGGTVAAALAFQAAKSGPVIVYASRPDWANSIARKAIERIRLERPINTNLVDESNEEALRELAAYLRATLGEQSLLPDAVSNGFALHHGGIPQRVRLVIEDEYRQQTLRLLIATNTIAQGVNFPTKTVIVHSFPYTDAPVRDFWNLAGRAGRALKETEGEVIILGTGNLSRSTLRRFLNRRGAETVESRVLLFVRKLLDRYPLVSEETITLLLNDPEEGPSLAPIIRAIDAYLLEIIAEDLAAEESDPGLESLVENLFATYQASVRDLEEGTEFQGAVAELMRIRRASVIARVPNGRTRRRYARAGLSVESSITFDTLSDSLREILADSPELDIDSFSNVMAVACEAVELEEENREQIAVLGFTWIESGRYDEVFSRIPDLFSRFDRAVGYVENVLCYRAPWVLNGLIRLLEDVEVGDSRLDGIPDWFRSLPDFLRYGADRQETVWVMSLGFGDRRFAEWLLQSFAREHGRGPRSFRDFLHWALEARLSLRREVDAAWPNYFGRLLDKILDRYSRISELLGSS